MVKITFMGAGSTVFARNVLGDCMCTPALRESEIALYDIDEKRLEDSRIILSAINHNVNEDRAVIKTYLGAENRKEALRNADFVVNAIQVGGYDPCIINDFEIPLKYGLRQTYADTLGIGGIMRGLRTIPVMKGITDDMEELCPNAWLLNYTNPMAIVTGAVLKSSSIKTIGLCHSVQSCTKNLMDVVGMDCTGVEYKIAGINHQAWLLEVTKDGRDLYPEIKARAAQLTEPHEDMVRYEIMKRFGYYVTESSQHTAEYTPYFIKDKYPGKLEQYKDWGRSQVAYWKQAKEDLVDNHAITHARTQEFASYILDSLTTGTPYRIHANVLNQGLIPNLPDRACVEVPCLVDGTGIYPCHIGNLPPQCAALNRTNINVQELTIEAALTGNREHMYHAAFLDPHTAAELDMDTITVMCDELIAANKNWLPMFFK